MGVSRKKLIAGPLRAGNGCVYSGFCSWRALETKDKTCAMGQEEPGLMQLDHLWQGSCSWGRKGGCGGGGWRKQLFLAELCMSQARNFHTATFSARPSSKQPVRACRRLLGDRNLNLGVGQTATEAGSLPHPHPIFRMRSPHPHLVTHCGSSNKNCFV